MKITNQSLLDLSTALSALDGAPQSDGTRKPYKIAWKATYAIARTTAAIRSAVEAFEKTRQAIIAPLSGGRAGIAAADPKWMEAQAALAPLLAADIEFEPHRFKLSDLKLEENEKAGTQIPSSVLSALLPILDDDTPAG